MPHLPIRLFRRLTLALLAVLFTGLAFSSVSGAEDFEIVKTRYKVELTGIYENEWQGQTSGFPDPNTPWSQETGKITAGFGSKKPWVFAGTKFKGDLPGTTKLPKFQLQPLRATVAKSKNRAHFKRKINYVAMCGGELGECDGTEKSGVESTSRNCRKTGRVPIAFDYDTDGFKPLITVGFTFHRSMDRFCGKRYPGPNSIDQLKDPFRMKGGLDDIAALKKGETLVRLGGRERGWIAGDGHPQGARNTKKCPEMSGVGSRQCWVTDLRIEVKRIK